MSLPETPPEQDEDDAAELLEDLEHLQLTLPEAFFLIWALDCLTVLDPKSVSMIRTSLHKC